MEHGVWSMECVVMYKWSTCNIYWVTTCNTQYCDPIQYNISHYQYSTIQPNIVQYTAVQYRGSAVLHVPHTTEWKVVSTQHSTLSTKYEYKVYQLHTRATTKSSLQYSIVQYSTLQYNTQSPWYTYSTVRTVPSPVQHCRNPAHMLQPTCYNNLQPPPNM